MSKPIEKMTISYISDGKPAAVTYENLLSFKEIPDEIRLAAKEIRFHGTAEGNRFSCFPQLEIVVWETGCEAVSAHLFEGCLKLKEIHFLNQVSVIEKNAFYDCVSLEQITAPGLKKLQTAAFAFCRKLKGINELISHLKVIPADCFLHCESITDIHFPESLRQIGSSAFAYCRSLETADLNPKLQVIYEGAFECSGLTEIRIPEKTMVYPFAFYRCNELNTVTIERKKQDYIRTGEREMYSIAAFSFAECGNLKSVSDNALNMPNSEFIFCYCDNLPRHSLNYQLPGRDEISATISGYFKVSKLTQKYFRGYNQGRLFVNDKEEHILLQWDTLRKANEGFHANIPMLSAAERKRDLTVCHYVNNKTINFTFIYTLEHSGMEDEVISHGFITNLDDGFYCHRVYLEKGEYRHIHISERIYDQFHKIRDSFTYRNNSSPDCGIMKNCETDL